jgi:hypothetical protein
LTLSRRFQETPVDPAVLFPWLAALFAVLGGWRWARTRQFRGAAQTWLLMAVIFAAVSVWLHTMR